MILNAYDNFALQLYWEGTKNFENKPVEVQNFIRKFFGKYQISVICEPEYTKDDRDRRIQYILGASNLEGLIEFKSVDQIRQDVRKSMDADIRLITGMSEERVPPPETMLRQPQAVMGMGDGDEYERDIQREVRDSVDGLYEYDEFGKPRTSNQREQLLSQDDVKTRAQYVDKNTEMIMAMIKKSNEDVMMAFQNMAMVMESKSMIQDTGTQLDGTRMTEMLKLNRKMFDQVQNLHHASLGGQSWDNVTLKDIPGWLKIKLVAGMKRIAIGAVTFPFKGPAMVINGFLITPLKLVAKRTNKIIEILQELWGWTIVVMVIAGTVVFMTSPTYASQRQNLSAYMNVINYVPVDIISEPTKKTIQILWESVPGQQLFFESLDLLKTSFGYIPGIIMGWFSTMTSFMVSQLKAVMTEAISQMTSGGIMKSIFG
jgi:hypothetical protein